MKRASVSPNFFYPAAVSILVLLGLYLTSLYNYLLFHSLSEWFSIAISFAIFLFAWNTRHLLQNDYLLFLGIAYLFVGFLDLIHSLSYSGMGIFTGYGPDLPTQLWIAARYVESLSLLTAPLFLRREIHSGASFFSFLSITTVLLTSVFYWHIFPACYIEGEGLTPFKKISEYIIALILLCAMVILYRNRHRFDAGIYRLLQASIAFTIGAELAFTFYVHVYGLSNLIGHYLKIFSFYLIYRAILATGMTKPYNFLFRELLQKEDELKNARDQLELRVEQRTKELAAANQQLQQEMMEKEVLWRELEKSEKRFRAIINAAEDVSFILINLAAFPKPRIIEFSPGAERLFGYSRDEIIGQEIDKFYSREDARKLPEIMELLLEGRKGFEGELNMVRNSGDSFPAFVSFTPVRNTFNGPTALGVSVDLSKAKQLEQELQKWIQVFRLAEWGICVGGAESTNLELMNPAFARMHGYTVQELRGKPLIEIFAPDVCADVKQHFCLADEKGHHIFESIHLRKDGSTFPVQVDVTAIKDDQGQVLYRVINLQDITLRKKAEKQLLTAKEEWERTFDAIGDVALILDPDFRVTRINQVGREIFAANHTELLGYHCHELFRGETAACPGCPAKEAILKKETHFAEMHHPRLEKTFLVSASPVVNNSGEVTSVVYFARDITSQKNLEKRLNQAQKMEAIGTLASGIAHDFNNILSPIIGYAEMLGEETPPESQTASDLKMILQAANRAKDLVTQILSFSRQVEQELQPLRIQYVLKEALKLLRATIPANIEIRQNIDMSCSSILADPTQVHQIIMNLCTNAYHAMREKGGTMEVGLQPVAIESEKMRGLLNLRHGSYVLLSISDTGHGMSPAIIERIFEPYFTTKNKGEGTGLGLSVVHGIIESLGGDIAVHSQLGKGTTFRVYFPVIEQEKTGPGGEKRNEKLLTGSERILIVDDEEPLIRLISRMLISLGYRVVSYNSSLECLAAFRARPDDFDLLLTDMNMPKMTGELLAREALLIKPGIPVILMTGFSEVMNEEKAQQGGIKKIIMKPIVKQDLARTIREVLDADGA